MTIKVYISGICGSQEVRKQQQRVLFILQSLPIELQVIDITEPGRDEDLTFMQEEAKKNDKKTQLPPQIFNDNVYCGDYTDFEMANDDDQILRFLKIEESPPGDSSSGDIIKQNGIGVKDNNEETPNTLAQPNLNGFDEVNSLNAEQDIELIKTDIDVNNVVNDSSTLEEPEADPEELVQNEEVAEVPKDKADTSEKEESAEESE